MLKLYLRAAIAVFLSALVTVLAMRFILDAPQDAVNLKLLGGQAELLADAIAHTPPTQRRAKARELGGVLGYPVLLEARSELPGAPRSEWREGQAFVVAAVPDTPGQLVLGPLPVGALAGLPIMATLALFIALVVGWFVTKPLFRRIRSLELVAAMMRRGDFSARAETDPDDPLDRIGQSLNQLADRIGQLLSDERDLLRTVAHEVRAPISRMRFRVERLHERAEDHSAQKDSAGLISDLKQVDSLFDELLTYVAFDEFDYERPELQTAHIPVVEAVSRVADEVTAVNESITVTVSGDAPAKVVANLKLFERAVSNLLLNAMAYGGAEIRVFVREFDTECVVDVQDSGPGIPEEDRPKVIKPFVRLSKKKTRGTGLGLAIVSRIMSMHHGRLHLLDAPGGGASVQLVWPNAEPKPKKRWFLGLFSKKARGLPSAERVTDPSA